MKFVINEFADLLIINPSQERFLSMLYLLNSEHESIHPLIKNYQNFLFFSF